MLKLLRYLFALLAVTCASLPLNAFSKDTFWAIPYFSAKGKDKLFLFALSDGRDKETALVSSAPVLLEKQIRDWHEDNLCVMLRVSIDLLDTKLGTMADNLSIRAIVLIPRETGQPDHKTAKNFLTSLEIEQA